MGVNIEKRDRWRNYSGKYQVPPGWAVTEKGTFKIKLNNMGETYWLRICPSPVKITGRGKKIDSEKWFLELSWKDIMGKEHKEFFPQSTLYTRSKIMKSPLKENLKFTSGTATYLVYFISDSVIYNLEFLENYTFTEKNGWEKEKNNINKKEGV